MMGPGLARVLERLYLTGLTERLMLNPPDLRVLMEQAKWLMPASILGFLGMHADRLVLASFISVHDFGLYAIAFMLASSAQTVAMVVTTNAAFPTFSEVVRSRPAELPAVLTRFVRLFDVVFVTLFAALAVSGDAVVDLLYDDRYREAGWMLQILAIGLIGVRCQITEQVYLAEARPQYTAASQACRLVAMVVGIYAGYRVDALRGALIGLTLSQFSAWPLAYYYQVRNGLFRWHRELLLLPAIVVGGGLGWGIDAMLRWLHP